MVDCRRAQGQCSFFDPVFVCPDSLVPGTVPWLLAGFSQLVVPRWLSIAWDREGLPGRRPWPARVLLALLVLQYCETGLSRRAMVERARTDLAWRAALGLSLRDPVPSRRVLGRFEQFLGKRDPETGVPRYLRVSLDVGRACLAAGVVGTDAVWAQDSTDMLCYGAVLDTVRQLGDGLTALGRDWARSRGVPLNDVAKEWKCPWMLAKSTKGYFAGTEWSDASARNEVIQTLAERAIAVVARVRREVESVRPNKRARLLRRCRNLLRVVAQDLEPDETGRLVVARRVVEDRLISLTDPEARHGRKSEAHLFDGFKLHVLGDVISGFIAAVCVTPGNAHDAEPACRLILRAKELVNDLDRVLGDTAYGGARHRYVVRRLAGVAVVAPPVVTAEHKDRVAKDEFTVDFDRNLVTCPQGITVGRHGWCWSKTWDCDVPVFKWNPADCRACPIREKCCGSRGGGKRILLHPYEDDLRKARAAWEDPAIRKEYRTRTQCERLVNQCVRRGGRRATTWGLRAAQLQAHLIAMASNLGLMARRKAAETSDSR